MAIEKVRTKAEMDADSMLKIQSLISSLNSDHGASPLDSLCHFTSKAVNSNAFGGIRLAADTKIDMPYVCVSAIGARKVPLDYVKMVSPYNTAAKALHEGYIPDDKTSVLERGKLVNLNNLDGLNVRLRQSIIKDINGEYLSVTPLHSSGFSLLLRAKAKKLNEDELAVIKELKKQDAQNRKLQKPKTKLSQDERKLLAELQKLNDHKKYRTLNFNFAVMSFGGTNPANIGMHAYSLSKPLLMNAPVESTEIKEAYRFYHKGLQLRIGHDFLREYYAYTQELKAASLIKSGTDEFANNVQFKRAESQIITRIVASVLTAAKLARESVITHIKIEAGELASLNEGLSVAGLMDVSEGPDNLRGSKEWVTQLAADLTHKFINTAFKPTKDAAIAEKTTLSIGQQESIRLINAFEREIRCQASI